MDDGTFSVPGFEVQDRLGDSALGRVYRGTRADDGAAVCITEIRHPRLSDGAVRLAILAHGNRAAEFRHPSVSPVIAVVPMVVPASREEVVYWIEAAHEGRPLREIHRGRLEVAPAARILRAVVFAVEALHAQSPPSVHGGIDSSSVFIAADDAPVLIGLGRARVKALLDGERSPTKDNDITGCGRLLAELLVPDLSLSELPEALPSLTERLRSLSFGAGPAPAFPLPDIARKCLSLDTEDRFPSASALRAAWMPGAPPGVMVRPAVATAPGPAPGRQVLPQKERSGGISNAAKVTFALLALCVLGLIGLSLLDDGDGKGASPRNEAPRKENSSAKHRAPARQPSDLHSTSDITQENSTESEIPTVAPLPSAPADIVEDQARDSGAVGFSEVSSPPLPPPQPPPPDPEVIARERKREERERLEAQVPSGFVFIEGGEYPVGCQDDDQGCFDDERPARMVRIAHFAMQRAEVTMEAYDICVAEGACPKVGKERGCTWQRSGFEAHPINCLPWSAAGTYCRHKGWRLPTEEEWEIAARGPEGHEYPWGDERPTCDRTVMKGDGKECADRTTMEGDARSADVSWCGVLGLGGGVREWVATEYQAYPDGQTEAGLSGKVNRGGSWQMDQASFSTSHTRLVDPDVTKRPDLGFRCALSLE